MWNIEILEKYTVLSMNINTIWRPNIYYIIQQGNKISTSSTKTSTIFTDEKLLQIQYIEENTN